MKMLEGFCLRSAALETDRGSGTDLVQDVHHGLGGQVFEVLSVRTEVLEQLHTGQDRRGVLEHSGTTTLQLYSYYNMMYNRHDLIHFNTSNCWRKSIKWE